MEECPTTADRPTSARSVSGRVSRLVAAVLFRALLPALLLTVAAATAAPWPEPEAFACLRVSPGTQRPHQVLALVPAPWDRRARGVSAYGPDEEKLYASPVFQGQRMVGVEVNLPRSKKLLNTPALAIALYLFEKPVIPRPIPAKSRRPVLLRRVLPALTTRPFTFAEMDRLSGRYAETRKYTVGVASLGAVIDRPSWKNPPGRRSAVLRWDATILLAEAATLAFGANRDPVAWFVAVDGRPAASWRAGVRRKEGGRFGAPMKLTPGFHAVTFYVVQRSGEPLPVCLWRRAGDPPAGKPLADLHPGAVSPGWSAQSRGGAAAAGVLLSLPERYRFVDAQIDLLRWDFAPVGACRDQSDLLALRLGGKALRLEDRVGFSLTLALPEITVRGVAGAADGLRTPQLGCLPPPVLLRGGIRFAAMPIFFAHREELKVSCRVRWPENLPEDARQTIDLTCLQLDDKGREICRTALVQPDRSRPAMATLRLDEKTARISCRALFQDRSLLPPADMAVVRPGDPAVERLGVQGRAAFVGSDRAILVCEPLPAGLWSQAPVLTSRKGIPPRVVLFDDFCATSSSADAGILPEDIANRVLDRPYMLRCDANAAAPAGTAPECRLPAAFGELFSLKPDAVILAIGALPLRAGVPPSRSCLQALFAAQCCRRRGITPIFVALPGLPGVPTAVSRSAALFTKEIALNLGAGIVDLYSAEKQDFPAPSGFCRFFVTRDRLMPLLTPNDYGRRWVGERVAAALVPLLPRSRNRRPAVPLEP